MTDPVCVLVPSEGDCDGVGIWLDEGESVPEAEAVCVIVDVRVPVTDAVPSCEALVVGVDDPERVDARLAVDDCVGDTDRLGSCVYVGVTL